MSVARISTTQACGACSYEQQKRNSDAADDPKVRLIPVACLLIEVLFNYQSTMVPMVPCGTMVRTLIHHKTSPELVIGEVRRVEIGLDVWQCLDASASSYSMPEYLQPKVAVWTS
jgi:hypothetical protein